MKFHDEMMKVDPIYAAAYKNMLAAEREKDWETAASYYRVMSKQNPFTFDDMVELFAHRGL